MTARIARASLLVIGLVAPVGCASNAPRPRAAGERVAPGCTARVRNGPWSVARGLHTATIRWESCTPEPAMLAYAPEDGGDWKLARASVEPALVVPAREAARGVERTRRVYVDEVQLGGLAPSTCYAYRVEGDSKRGRICTRQLADRDDRDDRADRADHADHARRAAWWSALEDPRE